MYTHHVVYVSWPTLDEHQALVRARAHRFSGSSSQISGRTQIGNMYFHRALRCFLCALYRTPCDLKYYLAISILRFLVHFSNEWHSWARKCTHECHSWVHNFLMISAHEFSGGGSRVLDLLMRALPDPYYVYRYIIYTYPHMEL